MLKFYEFVERPDCLFEDSSNLTIDFPALTGFTVGPEILVLLALLESSTQRYGFRSVLYTSL